MTHKKDHPGQFWRKLKGRHLRNLVVSATIAVVATTIQAEEDKKIFSLSGFGTIAAIKSTLDQGDYVTNAQQTIGSGRSREWDLGTDSRLALQLDAKFTDNLSAVVQVVSQRTMDLSDAPNLEWANFKYAFTPDVSVRVGRMVLPTYMVADTRLVGYSNTWIRPPVETYRLIGQTNVDGAEASYRMHFGGVTNTIAIVEGETKLSVTTATRAILKDITIPKIVNLTDTFEYGALTARVGALYLEGYFSPVPNVVATNKIKLFNVGLSYDPSTWFVQGEYTIGDFDTNGPRQNAYYATGGYRVGNFTPYMTYSVVRRTDPNAADNTGRDQSATSLGLRWESSKNTAMKVQWDRVTLGTNNAGTFTNATSTSALGGSSGNVISLGLDFVF